MNAYCIMYAMRNCASVVLNVYSSFYNGFVDSQFIHESSSLFILVQISLITNQLLLDVMFYEKHYRGAQME